MGQYIAPIAEEDEWRCVEGTVMRRPGSLSSREHVQSARPTHLWSLFGGALQCAFGLCSRPERTTFNAMYRLACRKDTGVVVRFSLRSDRVTVPVPDARKHVTPAATMTACEQKVHATQASYVVLLGNAPRSMMLQWLNTQ